MLFRLKPITISATQVTMGLVLIYLKFSKKSSNVTIRL